MKKTLLVLALCAATLRPPAGNAEVVSPRGGLMSVPAIAIRLQRDHRMDTYSEKYGSEQASHVGLFLSDQPAPYILTLGWFSRKDTKEGPVYLDEFGEQIPEVGANPPKGPFSKADLLAIRGFDTLTLGNVKHALSAFEDAAKLAPQSPKAHNNLGVCLALFQQLPRAQTEFELAIKLKPDYTAAVANRAWLDLAANKPKTAVEMAKKALSIRPDFKSALLAITKAYLLNGQIQDAKLSSQELARRWPNDAVIVELAGESFLAAGELKPAKQYYLKYAMLNPSDVTATVRIAEIYQRLGDLDNALKYAKNATHARADDSAAHLIHGRLLEANNDFRPAEVQYERALETAKTLEERVAAQGPMLRVLFHLNKLPDADKLSKKWAAEKGAPADCHYNRAWVASQIGGAPAKVEAIAEYQKALSLKSAIPEIHYNLGLLLADQGQKSEAQKELKLFIEQAPNDPDIQKARELLGKLSH